MAAGSHELIAPGHWPLSPGTSQQRKSFGARRLGAAVYVDRCHEFLHLPGALGAYNRGKIVFTLAAGGHPDHFRHLGPRLTETDLPRLGR